MVWITEPMYYLTYEQALNNANIVFNFFKDKGYTKEAICGLLGNMWRESHVNPNMVEMGGGGGYGIVQWTPHAKLNQKLAVLGLPDNGDNQLIVLQRELTDGANNSSSPFSDWYDVGKYNINEFKTTTDITYATECFMYCYERPGILHLEERIEYANKFYQDLTGEDSNGLQLAVLPIHYIHVTQSEFTPNYSHEGTEAVDMIGPHTRYPLYAPCDVICMSVDRIEAGIVWQSQKEVRRVDGSEGFITFNILHDDTHFQYNVGDTFKKGELFGHTGDSGNSEGDHLHIEASKEKFTTMWEGGGLPNPSKLWHIFSSCDNVTKESFPIINSGGIPWQCDLNWIDGSGGVDPQPPTRRKRRTSYTLQNIRGVYSDCYL